MSGSNAEFNTPLNTGTSIVPETTFKTALNNSEFAQVESFVNPAGQATADSAANPHPVADAIADAAFGAPGTGLVATAPPGATGMLGWLSGIYSRLGGALAQDGVDAASVTPPTGASGIRGWLSGIYSRLGGPLTVGGTVTANVTFPVTQAVSLAALPGSPSQDGTDGTGITAPTGGVGIRGWLSGIYGKLSGTVTVGGTLAVSNFPATQPVSGTVVLGAGAAALGTVGVTALPALPAGTNAIGTVALAAGSVVQATGATATALGLSASTVVKATPGRLFRVNVLTAGTAAGTVNDVATVAGAAVTNQIATIPNAVGVYDINAPAAVGIVYVLGTGQVVSILFS